MPNLAVVALQIPIGQECNIRDEWRRHPGIAFAELDYAVHTSSVIIPNDPGWDDPGQWGLVKINVPQAWSVTTGTTDIVVAVLDSGVNLTHEDLTEGLWTNAGEIPGNGIDDEGNGKVDDLRGWHFYHTWAWDGEKYAYLPGENGNVTDELGHGTHVAGIVGARFNNGLGIAGMAGGVRVMPVKVLNQRGDGWLSDVAKGIIYAADNGAQVINLSLGGEPSSQFLQEAVDYARNRGVLIVASTGNDGGPVLYPAACEHVLAVAATNEDDVRPSFSNHGPQVDVAAPGVDIYSTWYRGNYFTKSGTSMATPHVSGLAALIWSARPALTAAQVTEIITSTALDVNSGTLQLPGRDEYIGWGRIDAGRAVSSALNVDILSSHWYYLPLVLKAQ